MNSTKKERGDECGGKNILTNGSLFFSEGLFPNLHLQAILTGEMRWQFFPSPSESAPEDSKMFNLICFWVLPPILSNLQGYFITQQS